MKNYLGKAPAKQFATIAALLMISSTWILAQQPSATAPADTSNPERARQQDMSRREWQLRNFGTQPNAAPDRRQIDALVAQVEQDFNRILILHNQIARATSSEQSLDYGFVSEATAEIKKRAGRLQSNLALRESGTREMNSEKVSEFTSAELREALMTLCKEIKSFVTNPVIETPGTVNADQLTKARSDLEKVIKLSAHISKNAERLKKTDKKKVT